MAEIRYGTRISKAMNWKNNLRKIETERKIRTYPLLGCKNSVQMKLKKVCTFEAFGAMQYARHCPAHTGSTRHLLYANRFLFFGESLPATGVILSFQFQIALTVGPTHNPSNYFCCNESYCHWQFGSIF